jgi:diguanylate cyclase (GGDEF)-like protein
MAEGTAQRYTCPLPPNEEERLREVYALGMDGGHCEQIDRICKLARDLFKVPIALVPLVERERLTFLAVSGVELGQTQRDDSFCAYAILDSGPLIVEDLRQDPRFTDNMFVRGEPHVRFYASVPLALRPGINIGTLSIFDLKPRSFSDDDAAHLSALAEMVVSELRARRAERDLIAGKKRMAQTARMAKFAGYEWKAATGELVWDGEVYSIYGIPPGTPPNHELIVNTYDPDMREKARRRLSELFAKGVPYDVELRGTRPNGEIFWIRAMAEAEVTDGKVIRVFGAVRDVTDRKLAELRIHELAYRDPLTGLPNRVSFIEKLNGAIAAARETSMRVDLLKFNIDHFRDVNDALGHHIGDKLLQKISNALSQNFNAIGTVTRLGGDEFAVIVRGQHSVGYARTLAEDFIVQTRQLLRQDNYALPLGISGGLAVYPDHGENAETVMKNAKVALLRAKAQGRGNLMLFDPDMRKAADEKSTLIQRIWAGIANKEFTLHYQPIVALRAGKVTGLEALMRWNDPELGILPPSQFMVAFEEPDLAVALGDVAFDLAIGQMRQWLDAGIDFGNVAVNLSTAQFRLGDLAETILSKLTRAGVPPQRLTLEVTENVYMAWGADVVSATVRKLHAAGISIALDDFGTGYASLTHLRQFPIDKLKIDKSFVQSAESAAIVDAVINMGMSLGMEVVAEGVEKPEQLSLLRLKGCDYVQGYIFAKPLAPERIAGYIADFGHAATASARKTANG